jgi:hypothetical protein
MVPGRLSSRISGVQITHADAKAGAASLKGGNQLFFSKLDSRLFDLLSRTEWLTLNVDLEVIGNARNAPPNIP